MLKLGWVLVFVLWGNSLAQLEPWPPELQPGQIWSVTVSIGSALFFWRVELGQASQTVFRGKVSGADAREAEVGYFGPHTPESLVRDRLVFSFSPPSGVTGMPNAFLCMVSSSGEGFVPLSPGAGCTARLEAK